ncbi:hypothetical protein DTO282F9_5700 [Paecilomyces variotii]|nr:hypothetical protein DTO282F9_5700 [Paecilomyces variotii]
MYKSLAGHRTVKQGEISELAKRLNALLYVVMIRGMFDHEWFGQVIIHLPFATLKAPKGPVLIIAPSMTLAQNWEMQWNLHVDGSHPRTGMVLVKGYGISSAVWKWRDGCRGRRGNKKDTVRRDIGQLDRCL